MINCREIAEACWHEITSKLNCQGEHRRFGKSLPIELLSLHHFESLVYEEREKLGTMDEEIRRRTCCVIQKVEDCILNTFTKKCMSLNPMSTIDSISKAKADAYMVYVNPQKRLLECSHFEDLDDEKLCRDVQFEVFSK